MENGIVALLISDTRTHCRQHASGTLRHRGRHHAVSVCSDEGGGERGCGGREEGDSDRESESSDGSETDKDSSRGSEGEEVEEDGV